MPDDRGRSEGEGRLRPLHGGRHSLPPDVVAFNQRERLLAAVAAVVAEHGYNKATIAQIAEAASVSRRTFYENFEGKEDCFFAAYDALDDYLASLMAEAVEAQLDWADHVAATFTALLGFLASRPELARLYLVEATAVGESMASRRDRTALRFISLLEEGRSTLGDRAPAEGIEEALVGGAVTLLTRRILAGEGADLDRFAPAVIEFVLSPYLGVDGAREVVARRPE